MHIFPQLCPDIARQETFQVFTTLSGVQMSFKVKPPNSGYGI